MGMLKKVFSVWSWFLPWGTILWLLIDIILSILSSAMFILSLYVSLYLCISVAVSGEQVQIKNWLDFHFWYWLTDFVFEFSSIEIVVLTFKCELKKDANYISIFILATNKLKLFLLFKHSLAVIILATLTERCIKLGELWQNFLLS